MPLFLSIEPSKQSSVKPQGAGDSTDYKPSGGEGKSMPSKDMAVKEGNIIEGNKDVVKGIEYSKEGVGRNRIKRQEKIY